MKKLIACFAIAFLAMSFVIVEPVIRHYPDIMMTYDKEVPVNASPATEGFLNGVFVSECSDYFVGIDSVAVKYLQYKFKDKSKFETVYTNFYSRCGDLKWKKYDANKKFIGVVTEMRNDTLCVQKYSPVLTVVYYKVE